MEIHNWSLVKRVVAQNLTEGSERAVVQLGISLFGFEILEIFEVVEGVESGAKPPCKTVTPSLVVRAPFYVRSTKVGTVRSRRFRAKAWFSLCTLTKPCLLVVRGAACPVEAIIGTRRIPYQTCTAGGWLGDAFYYTSVPCAARCRANKHSAAEISY